MRCKLQLPVSPAFGSFCQTIGPETQVKSVTFLADGHRLACCQTQRHLPENHSPSGIEVAGLSSTPTHQPRSCETDGNCSLGVAVANMARWLSRDLDLALQ